MDGLDVFHPDRMSRILEWEMHFLVERHTTI